jgi:hypothetical protein
MLAAIAGMRPHPAREVTPETDIRDTAIGTQTDPDHRHQVS